MPVWNLHEMENIFKIYSAVTVLTNSPNILDLTVADFFQLNLS